MSDTPLLDLLRNKKANTLHGMSRPHHENNWLYRRVHSILQRCKNHPSYKDLQHQPEWVKAGGIVQFTYYLLDLPNCRKELTVDRIDPFKGYVTGNLRWADRKTQANNKRRHHSKIEEEKSKTHLAEQVINSDRAHLITHERYRMLLIDWCHYLDIPWSTLHGALSRSEGYYTESEIIGLYDKWVNDGRIGTIRLSRIPIKPHSRSDRSEAHYLYLGEQKQTISQWAKELQIKRETIKTRISLGWTDDEVLLTPVGEMKNGEKRKTRSFVNFIDFNGKQIPVVDFAKSIGQKYETVLKRMKLGWDSEKIKNTEPEVGRNQFKEKTAEGTEKFKKQCRNAYGKKVIYEEKEWDLTELCEYKGIKTETVHSRLNRGWSVEEAFNRPVKQYRTTTIN